jgi:hypothetical protein
MMGEMASKHGRLGTGAFVAGLIIALLWLFSDNRDLSLAALVLAGTIGDIRFGGDRLAPPGTRADALNRARARLDGWQKPKTS